MAKEAMMSAMVASLPHMEEETRAEVLNDWARAADQEPVTSGEKIGFDDFASEIKQRIM